jgi:hypothetical protein
MAWAVIPTFSTKPSHRGIDMRKYALQTVLAGFTIMTFLMSTNTVQAQERKVSRDYLAVIYLAFLTEEGYKPELKGEGKDQFILFKKAGANYVIEIRPDDPTFFRILKPNIWKVDSKEERILALEAASLSSGGVKIAKVYLTDDHVWISAETHVPNPEGFTAAFGRLMSTIETADIRFHESMRNLSRKKDN